MNKKERKFVFKEDDAGGLLVGPGILGVALDISFGNFPTWTLVGLGVGFIFSSLAKLTKRPNTSR